MQHPTSGPDDATSDVDLIARSRDGDVGAFEALVARHKRGVVAFAYGLVGDGRVAREVAHDAFCAVFYSLERLRDPEQFGAWVATITRNFALAHRRERRRRTARFRSLDLESEARAMLHEDGDPADRAERREVADAVLATVARLPDALRAVVAARYFDGLSCEEIAARQRTTVGTVTKQLTRARRVLRDRLTGLADEGGIG